jgi:hypothetical protein
MAKKKSRHQTKLKECRLKVKFHNSKDAWASASLLRLQNPGHEIDAYMCRWCNGWHLGHRIGHPISEPEPRVLLHDRAAFLPGKKTHPSKAFYSRNERKILYREYAKQEADDVHGA